MDTLALVGIWDHAADDKIRHGFILYQNFRNHGSLVNILGHAGVLSLYPSMLV